MVAVKSFDTYLKQILDCIEYRKTVDYASKSSVRKFNAAYARMVKSIDGIQMHYPGQKRAFFDLLSHDDKTIAYNIAWLILNRPYFTLDEKRYAFNVIKDLYYGKELEHLIDSAILHLILPEWEEKLAD